MARLAGAGTNDGSSLRHVDLILQRQTHLQNNHCLAKEADGKGEGLAKYVSRPKLYWASVGHPEMEGGGAQGL